MADGIAYCAAKFGLAEAEVTAVVSFYTMYKRHPVGDYNVGVCTNTLCAIMGGDQILAELSEHVGVCTNTLCAVMGGDVIYGALKEHTGITSQNGVSEDGKVSLEHIECNAACDFAPVVMVNWEFFDNQTPESARQLVDDLRSGNPVAPTRGASSVCTWREAERVLAGFNDGRADEGLAAGPATLEGLKLARERKEKA